MCQTILLHQYRSDKFADLRELWGDVMIRFEPFPIVISGNNRDDLLYEWWLLEKQIDPDAQKPGNLNEIERKPSVGPEAQKYEKAICEALLRVAKHKAGRQVLAATFSLPADLYILPVGERDKVMLPEGEFVGECYSLIPHISLTNRDDKVPPIKVTPENPKGCRLSETNKRLSKLDDLESTLVHEMVHAARPKAEYLKKIKTGDVWDDLEEFFSIIVENIYRSERRDLLLRGGHDSSVLPKEQTTSEGFMKDATLRERIKKVFKHEPLAQKLGRFKEIRFNPFSLV